MADEPIQVSIICNTYNQEKYIRSALEGFVTQKTTFPYEILVHDDASTDSTSQIIREYATRYPELIKPIFQQDNKYSKGEHITIKYQASRAKGRYFAICEGDDYWTDPNKLQTQYELMEKHPEIDICAHEVMLETNGIINGKVAPSTTDTVFSLKEVLLNGGGFVGTCSLFVRANSFMALTEFKKKHQLDYFWQIDGAKRGGMLYIAKPMGVYRYAAEGSWTSRVFTKPEKYAPYYRDLIDSLEELREELNHQADDVISYKVLECQYFIGLAKQDRKEMREAGRKLLMAEFKEVYRLMPLKSRIKTKLRYFLPEVYLLRCNH